MSKMAAFRNRARAATEIDADLDSLTDEAPSAPVVAAPAEGSDLVEITGLKTASPFQIDIFEHVAAEVRAYLGGTAATALAVEAVAGSGKTTTIVAAAKLIPTSMDAVFLAFNKAIADELGERLPKNVKAKTLNALGFGLIGPYLKALGVHRVNVNGNRTFAVMKDELTFQQKDDFGTDIKWLVGMCKSMGVIPVGVTDGVGVNGLSATDDVLRDIARHHGRHLDPVARPTIFSLTRRVLAKSWNDSNIYASSTIDFDDQKWLAVCKRPHGRSLARPQYDVVIVDEVQDVNAVDIEMIRMILKPGGLVIGVGDSKQAIYGFRGADTTAFQTFSETFSAKVLPLSITYRCGSALVQHAQELVPAIQPAPNAVEGEVVRMDSYKSTTFLPGDLVMCRNNAPLIEFAYRLIRSRVPVYVKGRNIGDGLVKVINDVAAKKTWVPNPRKPGKKMPQFSVEGVTVRELDQRLHQWVAAQTDLIRQEDPDDVAAVQKLMDQFDCIQVFIRANVDDKATTVVAEIESLFSDGDLTDKVICATIHKAKGLEADRAFMYRPDCLYPGWVDSDSWQGEQEKNLDYVARTRGKTLYAYLTPNRWED